MDRVTRRGALVAGLIVMAVVATFWLESSLSPWPGQHLGHTQTGHILGWIGFVLILATFAYPARKRLRPNQIWSKPWLYLHEILGILGPLLILVHSGAHFHAVVPVMALAALGLVVISGIVGAVLHTLAFRTFYERRQELAREGMDDEAIEAKLHALAAEEGVLRWWPWVHVPLTAVFVVLTVMHVGGALYFGGM